MGVISPVGRVPTTMLTGFLGVGKTTALRHLLQHKPKDEFWAIVLNEFGEVSVDSAWVGSFGKAIAVKEIPGGCLCCATAPVLRVGIQRLLQARWPDRLLIEPTGLGHPAKIAAMLRDPWMSRSLNLRGVLCLVDVREFAQERFRNHPIYAEQLRAATAVIASKSDVSDAEQRAAFELAMSEMHPPKRVLGFVSGGAIELSWLDIADDVPHEDVQSEAAPTVLHSRVQAVVSESTLVAPPGINEFVRSDRAADGYRSFAWIFSRMTTFSELAVHQLMNGLSHEAWFGAHPVRAKALMRTEERTWVSFNWRAGSWTSEAVHDAPDSRFEIVIESQNWPGESKFEQALLEARIS